ncbi:hypothetical protein D7Y27_07545 [Corallococcus sp. AB004]|uniref:hypothetical protein n=1 Tax=Corallococcus sp. AB038B TaxID=2316718 RepID=UPI000EA074F3|nr:hypothetical protein [Corallococcus sp. AB038B]RKH96226.1 hypothetical protein D7Y04_31510 [Corallococcus sp. AB038B]RKI46785.1 hypothetical protein D7Y27_07545 [Corallococcus sp. AB004]
MDTAAYQAFTVELTRRADADGRFRGLVALGSMAARDYAPDDFSDHDFFVVAWPGHAETLRQERGWLPRAEDVALAFRETAHGLKVVYRDGHLLEFAVFDLEELSFARVNRYRVLLDKGGVTERMDERARDTASELQRTAPDDAWLFGQWLTQVLVGVGRHARGEGLSGRSRLYEAVRLFCLLLARHVPAPAASLLDGLDPVRRVERVYPETGGELARALEGDTPGLARTLLRLAERELSHVPAYPRDGVAAVRARIEAAHR